MMIFVAVVYMLLFIDVILFKFQIDLSNMDHIRNVNLCIMGLEKCKLKLLKPFSW